MSGEVLGNGYKLEGDTLVPDTTAADTMIGGLQKAIRAQKSRRAVEHMRGLVDGLNDAPTEEITANSV